VPLVDTGDDVNENSIVARLTYAREGKPFTALFMGDAGMARESELIDNIDLRADFRISSKSVTTGRGTLRRPLSSFISAVLPRFAAISVGRHNLFGHPTPATIDTLQRARIAIFRTDWCGAVTITPKNLREFAVDTMLQCSAAPFTRR
jgi:competence protein ComEC